MRVGSRTAASMWIEVQVRTALDAGMLLEVLDDPAVAGAWQDNGAVRFYWPSDRWTLDALHALKRALSQAGGDPTALTVQTLPDQDWNAIWAQSVKPIRIGRTIVIRPSWERITLRPGDKELVIDPKQAFGTGHHATTQLLLEWLEEVITGGERVLDVGTGSGILAMAALRLGAAFALGIDRDPVAIDCAREYAAGNGFGSELQLRAVALTEIEDARFDLILANLDRRTLVETAAVFPRYLVPGGRLLLSGVLSEDRREIHGAFTMAGGLAQRERERENWLALEVTFNRTAGRPAV